MFHIFEFLTYFLITHDRSSCCDDFVDRLNRKWTVILILIFVTVLSSKQYIGEPLACFCPAHFTGAHVEYTNNICWISKDFYVPIETAFTWSSTTLPKYSFNEQLKLSNTNSSSSSSSSSSNIKFARVENLIVYYPFFLIAQAILFYVPYFFWKNIINRSAYDIGTLIYIAYESQFTESQAHREKSLRYLIRHIDRADHYYDKFRIIKRKNEAKANTCSPSTGPTSSFKSSTDYEYETYYRRKNQTKTNFDLNSRQENARNDSIDLEISNSDGDIRAKSFVKKAYSSIRQNIHKRINVLPNSNNSKNDEENSCEGSVDDYKDRAHFVLNQSAKNSSYIYSKLLFTFYLIVKVLYIVNTLLQFLLINKFIAGERKSYKITYRDKDFFRNEVTYSTDTSFWAGFQFGYKSIANLIEYGNIFSEKSRLLIFHTVIFCDFRIRMLGDHLHRHTVQCVVPVNIFTEKIFAALWFWLFFLNLINFYNFFKWIAFYFSLKTRCNFILNHLLLSNNKNNLSNNNFKDKNIALNEMISNNTQKSFLTTYNTEFDIKLVKDMATSYLMHDNMFIIMLISKNTNQLITRELVTLLLENYKRHTQLPDEATV